MRRGALAYLCLQATTEGQASHAHVHEIIGGLHSLGWEVDLFQPAYAGDTAPGGCGRMAEFARVQQRLARALRTGGYRALYVRGHPLALPAARAARRLDIPVVQECNGPYSDFYAVWPAARLAAPIIEYLARSQFRRADARIAVTQELAGWLERETGRPAVVIGNGANTNLFSPNATSPYTATLPERYAVFFGALSPWQGVDVLLAAAEHEEWPTGVSLVVIGDGKLRTNVDQASEHNHRIVSLGTLPYADVPGVVAASMCSIVLKHRNEDSGVSPLKLYESMACGIPVVVSDISGMTDVVRDQECGIVVNLTDAASVARAVTRLDSDPETARAMGERGRRAVELHYSWAIRAAATSDVMDSVLEATSTHH